MLPRSTLVLLWTALALAACSGRPVPCSSDPYAHYDLAHLPCGAV